VYLFFQEEKVNKVSMGRKGRKYKKMKTLKMPNGRSDPKIPHSFMKRNDMMKISKDSLWNLFRKIIFKFVMEE